MNTCSVILLESDAALRRMFTSFFTRFSFKENEDFFVVEKASDVEILIQSEMRQMFVTGSVQGSASATLRFIDGLRAKNLQLVTVCLSMSRIEGPFERYILKGGPNFGEHLFQAVRDFQSGALNRLQ